jgi:hypothetical protein
MFFHGVRFVRSTASISHLRFALPFGVEVKRADAPSVTPSIRIAKEALSLKQVTIVNPGAKSYPLANGIKAVGIDELIRTPTFIYEP